MTRRRLVTIVLAVVVVVAIGYYRDRLELAFFYETRALNGLYPDGELDENSLVVLYRKHEKLPGDERVVPTQLCPACARELHEHCFHWERRLPLTKRTMPTYQVKLGGSYFEYFLQDACGSPTEALHVAEAMSSFVCTCKNGFHES